MKIHALRHYPENANTAKQVSTYCGWHPIETADVEINKVTCRMCLLNMKRDTDQIITRYAKILGYITDQIGTIDQKEP